MIEKRTSFSFLDRRQESAIHPTLPTEKVREKAERPRTSHATFISETFQRSSPTVELTRRRDFNSSFAGPMMMRNTLPPLASNDLLGCAF